jgi:hypothetical protein
MAGLVLQLMGMRTCVKKTGGIDCRRLQKQLDKNAAKWLKSQQTAYAAFPTASLAYPLSASRSTPMHLLYLDDSGSAANPKEKYLVLGGVCVYERQVSYFTQELDKIAERLVQGQPDTCEFHASEIFSGRTEPWKNLTKDERREVIKEVLGVLSDSYDSARAFATVVHKDSFETRNPMEVAFEDICSRFDRFLQRVDSKGLIILDESTHATRLLEMSHQFRKLGTQWNVIRNIVDGPLFVTSRAFRCVQVADHVAYAVFRRFEAKDATYFDVFARRFDTDRKVIHGMSHLEKLTEDCMCIGCMSRR